ncbi:MAG: hypothetical protein WC748_02535 [Legionellales bacterium]|jgi:hypothetical protein
MSLHAHLCSARGCSQKKRLYPLLEKCLFSIIISDEFYNDVNCFSFFINLYDFQFHEMGLQKAKPFSAYARILREQLIAALEQEFSMAVDDFDKLYQFRSNRLALEILLLENYYPECYVDELDWVKLFYAAQHEAEVYISIRAMALIEQAYASFQVYDYQFKSYQASINTSMRETLVI